MLKLYSYKGCDSCRKALKWLKGREIDCEVLPIREKPPSRLELERMLSIFDGNLKKLFNTSGKDYREMKLGDALKDMKTADALDLLASNGNLIKRPFLISDERGLVGFNEDVWTLFFDAV